MLLFLLLGLFAPCLPVRADSIDVFVDRMNRFNRVFPQEKVYLHIDNTGYYMDETLWYKAYVFSTDADTLGSRSGVLYVELVDPYGEVVKSQKCKIEHGQARGQMELNSLLHSGFYELRAYTRYMLNWGSDAVFSRVIPIFEAKTIGSVTVPTIRGQRQEGVPVFRTPADSVIGKKALNIHFYPEGGHAVKGLSGRVAFDVMDRHGVPVRGRFALKGAVARDTLADGRGVITYKPSAVRQSLVITTSDGKQTAFDLPEGEAEGCVLHADPTDDKTVGITLSASSSLKGRTVALVWQRNGHVYDYRRLILAATPVKEQFDRASRRPGVNQLTVIDDRGQVLASRMLFIYPQQAAAVSLSKTEMRQNDSIDVQLSAQPGTRLSVSVVDVDQQTGDYLQDAASWWLLTSDLKGYIAHPETYLEADDAAHRKAADLLMMVQGWRRYDVSMMEGKQTFVMKQPLERQLMIDGELYPAGRNKNVGDVTLYMVLKNDLGSRMEGANKTDARGRYKFAVPDCTGDWSVLLLTGKDNELKNYYVGFNRQFSPQGRFISDLETTHEPLRPGQLHIVRDTTNEVHTPLTDRTIWLEEFTKTANWNKNTNSYWARETIGAEDADIVYDCESYARKIASEGKPMPSLIEFLKERNPNINGNDNLSGVPAYKNMANGFYNDGPAYGHTCILWFVDNYFVAATNMPPKYCPEKRPTDDEQPIEFPSLLDEVKRVYITFRKDRLPLHFRRWDDLVPRNFVIVNVYTGPSAGLRRQKGIHYASFEGFCQAENYDQTEMLLLKPDRDYRRTLFWDPDMTVGQDGKLNFSFRNNMTGKMFRVSAEGFTPEGQPAVLP